MRVSWLIPKMSPTPNERLSNQVPDSRAPEDIFVFFCRGELDGDVHPESFINKDSTYQNVDLAQETGKFEVSNNGDSKNGDLAISMWILT